MAQSYWFKRLKRELPHLSKEIRLVPLKHGFYRIYFKQAYIHEVYEEMPEMGYDIEDYDPRFESQSYYEEYEDNAELTRKIKNYKEGYWDSINRIKTRVWLLRHDKEFYDTASRAYGQFVLK